MKWGGGGGGGGGGQRVFGQSPPHCPVISLTRCNRPDRKGRSVSPNNATFTLSGKFAFISKLFPWQRTLLCLKPYVHCRNCNNNGVNKWIDSIILFVLFNFLLFRKNNKIIHQNLIFLNMCVKISWADFHSTGNLCRSSPISEFKLKTLSCCEDLLQLWIW